MKLHFALIFVAAPLLLCCPWQAAAAGGGAGPDQGAPPQAMPAGWRGESGTASYYGPKENGRRSASGRLFDDRLLTAAHPWLPFGTKVRVILDAPQQGGTRGSGGIKPGVTARSVVVTITDRLHARRRIVDLSAAAARQLGIIQRGTARVTLVPA